MTPCHLRGSECSCTPDICKAAPVEQAPVFIPEHRDYLTLFAFAIVFSLIAAGTMYGLNQQGIQIAQQARV